jgi:hypothetical protein
LFIEYQGEQERGSACVQADDPFASSAMMAPQSGVAPAGGIGMSGARPSRPSAPPMSVLASGGSVGPKRAAPLPALFGETSGACPHDLSHAHTPHSVPCRPRDASERQLLCVRTLFSSSAETPCCVTPCQRRCGVIPPHSPLHCKGGHPTLQQYVQFATPVEKVETITENNSGSCFLRRCTRKKGI